MYDVIIIGAGPAGASASLYTHRANLKTLILYREEGALEKTNQIENYYGFADGISGKKLYEAGIQQAKNIGVEVRKEEVTNIQFTEKGFNVITENSRQEAKAIILATGNKKKKPKIKGIEDFEGKGVSYCAVCDGFFYRNRSVSVIGNGNYAISEVNELINLAGDITILTNGEKAPEFRADNVVIDTKEIDSIEGENTVQFIKFKDGSEIETEGVFIAEGMAGSIDFAKKLGVMVDSNKIIVNEKMETNVKGIYACGDCTGGFLQIAKAVYEGMTAGTEVIQYIRK
mgnify:CR=1 FL=1